MGWSITVLVWTVTARARSSPRPLQQSDVGRAAKDSCLFFLSGKILNHYNPLLPQQPQQPTPQKDARCPFLLFWWWCDEHGWIPRLIPKGSARLTASFYLRPSCPHHDCLDQRPPALSKVTHGGNILNTRCAGTNNGHLAHKPVRSFSCPKESHPALLYVWYSVCVWTAAGL